MESNTDLNTIEKIEAMLLDLKGTRISSGYKTIREAEGILGMSNAYISQLETGKISNPSWDVVKKLFITYHGIHVPINYIPKSPNSKSFLEKIIQEYEYEFRKSQRLQKIAFENFIRQLKLNQNEH